MDQNSRATADRLDRPLADLRISLTDRCNFNCNYCMPDILQDFLPRAELLSFEEIARIAEISSALGVRKIKLTGGEPLLRSDVDQLLHLLRRNPLLKDIGLISNGVLLPEFGAKLRQAGLDRVSISLDALDYNIFQKIVGKRYHVGAVLAGIDAAQQLGFSPIKINCVVQRGVNDGEVLALVERFRKPQFHLRFIEFMDVGRIHWKERRVVPSAELLSRIREHYNLRPVGADYYGEVAERYVHEDAHGNSCGEIGFISAVSRPFCRSCTRLRLSSDGKLYKCLFSSDGLDVKALLRSGAGDDILREEIRIFWEQRDDRYSEQRSEFPRREAKPQRKAMHFMGG